MNRQLTSCWAVSAFALGVFAAASRGAYAQMEGAAPPATSVNTPLAFSQLSKPGSMPARLQLKSLGKGWQRLTVEND